MTQLGPSTSKRARFDSESNSESDVEYEIVCDFDLCEAVIESDQETFSDSEDELNFETPINVTHKKQTSQSKNPISKISTIGHDPIDYFNSIATEEFYKLVVDATNINANEMLSKLSNPNSRFKRWKNVTVEEFKVFLGVLLHMGTIKMNRLNNYWKTGPLFDIKVFPRYISRDRFLIILRALNFDTNLTTISSVNKILPLINYFNEKMSTICSEKFNDEMELLVFWRSKLHFWQGTKENPMKYGIKLVMLGKSCGVMEKLVVYAGTNDREMSGIELGKGVANNPQTFVGHYIDVALETETFLNDIETNLSENSSSGNKKAKLNNPLKPKNDICTKRTVREFFPIYSEFDDELNEKNQFTKASKKPKMFIDFIRPTAGIDYHDQLMSYYPLQKKTLRWYKKLGIHIFQTMLLNAFYLYNAAENKSMDFYDFRLIVINSLLGSPMSVQKLPKLVHLPSFCEKNSQGKTKRKRCKICWERGRTRKDSIFYCPDCPDSPGLCLEPCFGIFHKYR